MFQVYSKVIQLYMYVCVYVYIHPDMRKVKVLVAQSCPTLCDPMDWSPPGFSVPGFSRQESGRKGLRPHLPCWPGEGAAQVSWLSGFGHVRLAQFRSWSRQAREVPRPCKDNRFPTPEPRGDPLKRARPPGPPHRGPPEQFIQTHPPLPKETEKSRKWGSEG